LLQNCSVGIVGKDTPFTIYDDEPVDRYVSFIALRLYCDAAILISHVTAIACLSICSVWAYNCKTKRRGKSKIGLNIPQGWSKTGLSFSAYFDVKGQGWGFTFQ